MRFFASTCLWRLFVHVCFDARILTRIGQSNEVARPIVMEFLHPLRKAGKLRQFMLDVALIGRCPESGRAMSTRRSKKGWPCTWLCHDFHGAFATLSGCRFQLSWAQHAVWTHAIPCLTEYTWLSNAAQLHSLTIHIGKQWLIMNWFCW